MIKSLECIDIKEIKNIHYPINGMFFPFFLCSLSTVNVYTSLSGFSFTSYHKDFFLSH